MNRHTPLKYLKLELGSQLERFKYALATTKGWSYCPFPPRKIAIEPSSFCNLRCIHCAHGDSAEGVSRMTRPKSNMSLDVFKKITDEASRFRNRTKFVFAMMGEPLMNKKMVEMIAYAHKKGVWTQLNTNAVLLSRKKGEELIDAGLDFMYLSLDGITRETYEKIRVRGDFERVLTNILDFIELKYQKGALDLTIHIGMTAEIINRGELDFFVKEFSKLPLDAVYSPMLFNWLSAIEWADGPEAHAGKADLKDYPVCNTSWDVPGIQANGDFVPCLYDFDGRYSAGNVADNTILELWNNERLIKFRRAVLNRDYAAIEENGPMCSQCTILWNSHYQIKPGMRDALGQIFNYSVKALKDYHNARSRRNRLTEKYAYLRDFREQFVKNLQSYSDVQEEYSHVYNQVLKDGVLEVRV